MLWLAPASILLAIATFLLGYKLRDIEKRINQVQEVVKLKVDKKPEEPEVISTLIDPTDPIQEAIWEHNQMMKKINPDEN